MFKMTKVCNAFLFCYKGLEAQLGGTAEGVPGIAGADRHDSEISAQSKD